MRTNTADGFSFVELMASLAIMAALLLIAVPTAQTVVQRHRESNLRDALSTIRGAIDDYKQAVETGRITTDLGDSGYPPNLTALVEGVEDQRDPEGRMIYFLRRMPSDPFYPGGTDIPAAEAWGLRSYASPPDAPEEGADVFDVYSTSGETGLNGVPYRDW